MAKITAPVKGFNGTVALVRFANGVGETESETALNYFRRHGYEIEGAPEPKGDPENSDAGADPKDDGDPEGTKGDGDAPDPDAPKGDPEAEKTKQPERPDGRASVDTWREYAVARGINAETAADMNRDEVKEAIKNLDEA